MKSSIIQWGRMERSDFGSSTLLPSYENLDHLLLINCQKSSVIEVTFTKDTERYKIASLQAIISVNTKKKRKWRQNIYKIITFCESAWKSKPLGQQMQWIPGSDRPLWREQDMETHLSPSRRRDNHSSMLKTKVAIWNDWDVFTV